MEIINLFILMSIYYLIYFLEFYQRFLLIVGSSMFVSLLTHVQVVKKRVKILMNIDLFISPYIILLN